MTLVEVMVAVALSSILLAMGGSLWLFGSRSFAAMGNYTDLDAKSRNALDQMSRDIRQATAVTAVDRSKTAKSLTVTNTVLGTGATYTWQASTGTLTCQKPGQAEEVYLTGCDGWDFELYQRTPQKNGTYTFSPATNAPAIMT